MLKLRNSVNCRSCGFPPGTQRGTRCGTDGLSWGEFFVNDTELHTVRTLLRENDIRTKWRTHRSNHMNGKSTENALEHSSKRAGIRWTPVGKRRLWRPDTTMTEVPSSSRCARKFSNSSAAVVSAAQSYNNSTVCFIRTLLTARLNGARGFARERIINTIRDECVQKCGAPFCPFLRAVKHLFILTTQRSITRSYFPIFFFFLLNIINNIIT